MTAPTPPPAALRDILAEALRPTGVFCGVCDHEVTCPDCQDDLGRIADAILADPRIAVTLAPTRCPTCRLPRERPSRRMINGKMTVCNDPFHTNNRGDQS